MNHVECCFLGLALYKDWLQVGQAQDGSSTYTSTPTYMYITFFLDKAVEDNNLVLLTM